jgi:hypothetical protein
MEEFLSVNTSKKYITPLIHSGLGNQLFMIANAYAVAKDNNRELIINDYYFGPRKTYWDTLLKNIKTEKINFKEYTIQKDTEFTYHNVKINENKNCIALQGYFQSEKFFEKYKDDIKNLFKLPEDLEKFAKEKISSYNFSKDIVAVHIRRGDYIGSDLHRVLPLEYYKIAMEFIVKQKNVEFLFFSEDKEWIHENFGNVKLIECEKDYEEFAIMQKCHHFINANSSFAWWAAYLSNNSGKIVIAPKNYFIENKINIKDLYPENWIII